MSVTVLEVKSHPGLGCYIITSLMMEMAERADSLLYPLIIPCYFKVFMTILLQTGFACMLRMFLVLLPFLKIPKLIINVY